MKPNVWKKISSVIIILIMMIRNVHTRTGTCDIKIEEKAFQLMNSDYWLTVNSSGKPDLEMRHKHALCSFQPKYGNKVGYYLFDMTKHVFICSPKKRRGRKHSNPRAGKRKWTTAVSKRQPRDACFYTEHWYKHGYLSLFGDNNTTMLYVHRRGVTSNDSPMGMLLHTNMHVAPEQSCRAQLRDYCHTLQRHRKKSMASFQAKFCNPNCWT